ncbi:hypothetical protein LZ30DRAFT_158436 [Colletotrichum cereale]|nr:hypothetical protein LZ30DRAFT_158436 [Colletotrichum cereale]
MYVAPAESSTKFRVRETSTILQFHARREKRKKKKARALAPLPVPWVKSSRQSDRIASEGVMGSSECVLGYPTNPAISWGIPSSPSRLLGIDRYSVLDEPLTHRTCEVNRRLSVVELSSGPRQKPPLPRHHSISTVNFVSQAGAGLQAPSSWL